MEELVSVIVLSYNSRNTILDTLESIFNQTYTNIELIVSDDFSKDNTKECVTQWIETHKSRFQNVVLNFKKKNEGVTKNCSDALALSSGVWIKNIAADDKLINSCIAENMEFVNRNKCDIVFSDMICFSDEGRLEKIEQKVSKKLRTFCALDLKKQRKKILRDDPLPAPSAFFSKKMIENVNGYDLEIKMLEDWPLWIKVLNQGYRIYYNNSFTVEYRVSEQSISHSTNFWPHVNQVKKKYCYPNIGKLDIGYYAHEVLSFVRYKLLCIVSK